MDTNTLTQVILPVALFLIMLGIGLSLSWHDFTRLTEQPKAVITGLLAQLVGLPAVALLVVMLFALPPWQACAIMILAFAPGGATSNMISYLCKADTALSVTLTALASLITPLSLPLFAAWAVTFWLEEGWQGEFPVWGALIKLLVISLVPVLVGVWLHHRIPGVVRAIQPWVKWFSLIFMLMVVVGIVMANKAQLPDLLATLGIPILVLALLAMLLGWSAGRLSRLNDAQCWTLSIETGIQNAGQALLITGAILQHQEMSAVVLLYGVLMQAPALLLILWRNMRPVGV